MMNPFKEGTAQYNDFETMKDLKWHCSKCELESAQAKTWQIWRQEKGIQIDTDEDGNYYKIQFCNNCKKNTYHRKLKSLELLENTISRSSIPEKLVKKIKTFYNNIDEYSCRKEPSNLLEIDHRIPQIRWSGNEDINDINMTEKEIEEKFMLLTRSNNLLKSRKCEQCKKTGIRAKGYQDTEFWWIGNKQFDINIGCIGCFWHSPKKWMEELNKKIK